MTVEVTEVRAGLHLARGRPDEQDLAERPDRQRRTTDRAAPHFTSIFRE
jgi:hypothetical protein